MNDISIPLFVREIENDAFGSCANLSSMDLAEHVVRDGPRAFKNCVSLTTVTIKSLSSNLYVGYYVFLNCSKLATITMHPTQYPK